ncbi:hypothetical protein Adt_38801 [Abeliophyllum distichum]|uniref:VTT domain-containing protein n=1 Tax=Abeliophyllum distichum TaxID=126358 RepID=A0ABD1Q3G0_9LAMI
MAVLTNAPSLFNLPPAASRPPHCRNFKQLKAPKIRLSIFSGNAKEFKFKLSTSPIKSFQHDSTESYHSETSEITPKGQDKTSEISSGSLQSKTASTGSSFLSKLGIVLGIAAVITLISVGMKQPNQGSSPGIQFLRGSSSSTLASPAAAFSFKAFGHTVLLPEYAPGWIYFWLLMAAGCGLFISEEALNIWVGITLARMLSLDGMWQSLVDSFSRNAPYVLSTIVWVYWGVCISDMIPFYLGKVFRKSGASDDISSKLGIDKEKAMDITRTVQKYGNLIGFVERFSIGVRNPTAFLAGAMDVSPECFFAGVCCGGLITLPIQLGIGFLLRERPVFALATVATVVGIWTVFPYTMAAVTAAFLYLRHRYLS